ncbi:hypothetical protein LIER_14543 [Lithospermum erythrorhizon]|uniref:CCDC93 coiled-coil domain-containing protein n=1 Tax=Lithospermum erythrorhizon TaxID=34254 RepID=A0AAV3Q455_LITER
MKTSETSIGTLKDKIQHINQRKTDVSSELKVLKEKIEKSPLNSDVQKLILELKLLKDIERHESESQSLRVAECLKLDCKINELEKILQNVDDEVGVEDVLDRYLSESNEKLNQAKGRLATKDRTVLQLKRQIDDIPTQGELIQYERRLSELYTLIQGKLRQTRRCYATYNALLEIKELMLKETSLLNSISSQFHNAISSPSGEAQLVGSMQGISQGSQQKLKKILLDLQAEQKVHGTLKEKYAAAMSEQRLCKSLLQAFQAECAKNEQLRDLASQPHT